MEEGSQRPREIITSQNLLNICLVDKLKFAGKSKKPSTSGCQSAAVKGKLEVGSVEIAAFGKLLPSCTYCLCGSTVKYLVESLGSLLASRASSCEDEPNTGEDKVGLANILCLLSPCLTTMTF